MSFYTDVYAINSYCDSLRLKYQTSSLSLSSAAITSNKTLLFEVNDEDRTLSIGGNISISGAMTTVGGYSLIMTQSAITNITLPVSGTVATLGGSETFTNKTIDDLQCHICG
jgi:hypothetical protein